MKRVRVVQLLLIAILVAATAGCGTTAFRRRGGGQGLLIPMATPGPSTSIVVEVFGTQGIRFGGSFGELGATKNVEGTVPSSLTLKSATGFYVALQKRGPEGELGIRVSVDGRHVKQSSTTRQFGVVTFTYRAAQK